MTNSSAARLLHEAGLQSQGPVPWGTRVPCRAAGVYVIETPRPLTGAPINRQAVAAWIERVETLRVDGQRPSTEQLARRLESFWIPGETVVYVGLAGTSVAQRVHQFYRTPLGDGRPHAGGHWLKTLENLGLLLVWWAKTHDAIGGEKQLLRAFAKRHGGAAVLPFANRQGPTGIRKPHGITASTLRTVRSATTPKIRPAEARGSTPRRSLGGARASVEQINAALQRLACADPDGLVRAVDAARELDRLGILRDSPERPGLPLRRLLRDGKIRHAYQERGRWWLIRCGG